MSIEATRPTALPALAPGVVIRTDEGDLTVDEIRRSTDGWTVFGLPVGRDRRRRVAVTYGVTEDAAIIADKADLDRLRHVIARYAEMGADAAREEGSSVVTADGPALEVDGWEVTL